jgi:hypothetical protein
LLQFGELIDNVEERSKKLKVALENAGVGSRPVVFIAHCNFSIFTHMILILAMGGLVAKEMLSHNEDLLNKTVGVLFMGTPHRGTPVISSYLKYLRPSQDTKLLLAESQLSKELHERFIEKANDKIPLIVSIIEMDKAPFFGQQKMIVTPESSFHDKGAVYHVKEHHYNICKPDNIFSTSYCVVLNFIKDSLLLIKQNS